ncbi:MAG: DUF4931 domain-containing protein [bacterium]
MTSNQFRRDPITGRWTIIVQYENYLNDVILKRQQPKDARGKNKKTTCSYCEGFEAETPSEIYAIRNNSSQKNEPGWKVRVVPEQTPMLQIYGDLNNRAVGMYDVLDGIGAHELIIESPKHNDRMASMDIDQISDILTTIRGRILDLKRDERFRYVLFHKNYGEESGAVVGHSYSHIIATPITPTLVKSELMNAMEYFQYKERCVFCDVINQELSDSERVVMETEKYLAFAPFASRTPFETWILPKDHETFFEWNVENRPLAEILREILRRLTKKLANPNYIMVLHSGPNIAAGKLRGYWKTLERDYHWHIKIAPKFRGYKSFEIGSGFQVNMVPPEVAAKTLRSD